MSHVDDGTLHALVDDELAGAERTAVEAHLASCGDCARRFAEATAMAREVHTLLGALDLVPSPARVVAPPSSAPTAAGRGTTPRARGMAVWQRVAVAASLLVVAGVSYRVGLRDPIATSAVERTMASAPGGGAGAADVPPVAAVTGEAAALPAAAPSVGSAPVTARRSQQAVAASTEVAPAASQALAVAVAAPAPPPAAVAAPRASIEMQKMAVTPQMDSMSDEADRGAAQVAARRASGAARAAAGMQAPAAERRLSTFANTEASAVTADASPTANDARATGVLAGYRSVDEVTLPSVIRRRYVSADGTTLVLIIAPSTEAVPKPTAKESPEFTVSTTNGRSTVRWRVPGRAYELQGALTPDSLVKLATLLK